MDRLSKTVYWFLLKLNELLYFVFLVSFGAPFPFLPLFMSPPVPNGSDIEGGGRVFNVPAESFRVPAYQECTSFFSAICDVSFYFYYEVSSLTVMNQLAEGIHFDLETRRFGIGVNHVSWERL